MYQYDNHDALFLKQRASQFSKQIDRYLKRELNDDQFRGIRLRNGLYKELHAYMLRVAIPYGTLNAKQLKQLSYIASTYDKGYAHFTTRQNIQFNWIQLTQSSAVLADLAKANLHAIQTSGKVVRNITADPLSGVRSDEIADARPYCELVRQWFTLHPEFSWLPGKFKIAINGAKLDEIGLKFHDLGLQLTINDKKQLGFSVYAGGGLGAAPMLAVKIKSFVAQQDILSYLESVLRVYNLEGRRDHDKKLRIKFLIKNLGGKKFAELVEKDWSMSKNDNELKLNSTQFNTIKESFSLPIKPVQSTIQHNGVDASFDIWKGNNVSANKISGYSIVTISLTKLGSAPGNISAEQLKQLAKLAKNYSSDEVRTTKKQSLVFPFVKNENVFKLWRALQTHGLDSPHNNTLAHIVACPGSDYCSLAKTASISVAQRIQQRFDKNGLLYAIDGLNLHISGCENSCAHHHVADIGLLGLIKNKQNHYQIVLGGSTKNKTVLGKKIGKAISTYEIVDAVEKIVDVYLENKTRSENFNQVFKKIGIEIFKERVYG